MCDTMIANREMTVDGYAIFGKNSDRSCNEPQYFVHIPRAEHASGECVQCTYVPVRQVRHTNALLLSKPSWIWGGEMGLNEHGVCIGNEAIYSRETSMTEALLGMDLLRLALERARSARQAVEIITDLLQEYGQGGNGSFDSSFYYDNSFMITDPSETWYLETAGKFWAAEKVSGVLAISNHMRLGKPDLEHPDARSHAREKGYPMGEPFDFAGTYTDWARPQNVSGAIRGMSGQHMMELPGNRFTLEDMLRTLKSHTTDDPWGAGDTSVCKHAVGPGRESSSTNAMIAVMKPGDISLWGTGMSTPCIAPFQPFWFDTYSPQLVYSYKRQEQALVRWLQLEQLNRAMLSGRLDEEAYQAELLPMQTRWLQEARHVDPAVRQEFCDSVAAESICFTEKWLKLARAGTERYLDETAKAYWTVKNAQLGQNRTIAY